MPLNSAMAKRLLAEIVCARTEARQNLFVQPLRMLIANVLAVVCVSKDPSTERRHPRGYIESLEQHNTALEEHIAQLERNLREHHPEIEIDNLLREPAHTSNGESQDDSALFSGSVARSDWSDDVCVTDGPTDTAP